jgi:hypothetical protein
MVPCETILEEKFSVPFRGGSLGHGRGERLRIAVYFLRMICSPLFILCRKNPRYTVETWVFIEHD